MARQPQVTRTIQTTVCNVLCLDLINKTPVEREVTISRTYKDERHMMKKIEAIINNDTIKAVHIINYHVEETLYGMPEQEFIEKARILPPRNSK